jgi:hypothetical protein
MPYTTVDTSTALSVNAERLALSFVEGSRGIEYYAISILGNYYDEITQKPTTYSLLGVKLFRSESEAKLHLLSLKRHFRTLKVSTIEGEQRACEFAKVVKVKPAHLKLLRIQQEGENL